MRILSRCLKSAVATTVLLLGSNTFCYADVLVGGALRNMQIDPGQSFQISASAPEPATMLLLGIGLVLLAGVAKKGKGEQ